MGGGAVGGDAITSLPPNGGSEIRCVKLNGDKEGRNG